MAHLGDCLVPRPRARIVLPFLFLRSTDLAVALLSLPDTLCLDLLVSSRLDLAVLISSNCNCLLQDVTWSLNLLTSTLGMIK